MSKQGFVFKLSELSNLVWPTDVKPAGPFLGRGVGTWQPASVWAHFTTMGFLLYSGLLFPARRLTQSWHLNFGWTTALDHALISALG